MVEQNWARERGYDVGDRVPVAGPTGRTELPIIGIFKLTSSLNVGGLGYAAMPLDARRFFDQPKGWMQISIVAEDRGEVARSRSGSSTWSAPAPASRPLARCRTRSQTSLPGSTSSSTSSRAVLRRRRLILEQLQHDRAPAHARARDAPHARRLAAHGDELGFTEALVLGIVGTVLGLGLGLLLASGLSR